MMASGRTPKTLDVLILTSATGSGHASTADAIREELLRREEVEIRCLVLDFFEVARIPLLSRSPEIYRFLVNRAPCVYSALFLLTDTRLVCRALAWLVYLVAGRRVVALLRHLGEPQVVISVHPLLISDLMAISRRRQRMVFTLATVVSDPVRSHASWACPDVDLCFVPTVVAKQAMLRHGVSGRALRVVGFPVRARFLETGSSKQSARLELGVDVDQPVALIMGGGNGSGPILDAVQVLQSRCPDVKLLVLAGDNKKLRRDLKVIAGKETVVPSEPFDVALLMNAADVVMTKAGPSTIFECAALSTPMVITAEVGPQERGNASLVVQLGLGLWCRNMRDLPSLLIQARALIFSEGGIAELTRGAEHLAAAVVSRHLS